MTGILLLDNNLKISEQDYQDLRSLFLKIANNNTSTIASKAVFLQRIVHDAIKNKLAGNMLSDIDLSSPMPKPDATMAKVIRGMFLTFLEQRDGLPGLFKIVKGISSIGFGIGSFSFGERITAITYSDLKRIISASDLKCIEIEQNKLLLELIKSDNISRFTTVRRGSACIILACAFFSVYSALCAKEDQSDTIKEAHLISSRTIILEKFAPQSKELSNLFAQSMFVQLFESLFSREPTVFSIFTL